MSRWSGTAGIWRWRWTRDGTSSRMDSRQEEALNHNQLHVHDDGQQLVSLLSCFFSLPYPISFTKIS